MQKLYDQHLTHWKVNAVAYHDYQKFGMIFDRKLKWEEKAKRAQNFSSE